MNCQGFQSNTDGPARGALLEARTRDEAAAHEESCAACASRLADERALTAGLRALAATMREKETPARAEAALLAAFRSRASSTSAATPSVTSTQAATPNVVTTAAPSISTAPSNVVSLSEHAAGAKHWSWVKTVAVAAMAAAAVALFMLVPPYLSTPPTTKQTASNNIRGEQVQTHDDTAQNAGRQNTTAQSNINQDPLPVGGAGSKGLKDADEYGPSRTLTPRRNVVRAMNVSLGGPPRGVAPERGMAAETAGAGEITTEFIPLVQYAGFAQSEGAHLVRVELPRSALASFGIPVNADRAGGRVKADVLLGEDGTARAIRFVR
jgi:hypothetical protein